MEGIWCVDIKRNKRTAVNIWGVDLEKAEEDIISGMEGREEEDNGEEGEEECG